MAWHTILHKPGPRCSAGLEKLSNIVRALLCEHGFAPQHEGVKHSFEGNMLTVLHGLAGQLAANGLKSGKELEPAGTNGPLPCMLHTHMFPEKEELVVDHGLLRVEACNRRLRDADEHALFKWGAAVGQGGCLISRPTRSSKAKFGCKLAHSAQFLIMLHDSSEEQVDVNHKLNVSLLL